MNFIYPDALQEAQTGKYLCVTKDGNLGTIDKSLLSAGTRPVVGEVIWLPFELDKSVKEYKRINGGLFSIEEYPEAAAVLDGLYNLGDEPEGFMRMPNMEEGQLFARQCSDSLPLGTISPDTFKRHAHNISYSVYSDRIFYMGVAKRPKGWHDPDVTLQTNYSAASKFNETAMKNVVMVGYMRMLP